MDYVTRPQQKDTWLNAVENAVNYVEVNKSPVYASACRSSQSQNCSRCKCKVAETSLEAALGKGLGK